jgi:regulator of replication initiation timing
LKIEHSQLIDKRNVETDSAIREQLQYQINVRNEKMADLQTEIEQMKASNGMVRLYAIITDYIGNNFDLLNQCIADFKELAAAIESDTVELWEQYDTMKQQFEVQIPYSLQELQEKKEELKALVENLEVIRNKKLENEQLRIKMEDFQPFDLVDYNGDPDDKFVVMLKEAEEIVALGEILKKFVLEIQEEESS